MTTNVKQQNANGNKVGASMKRSNELLPIPEGSRAEKRRFYKHNARVRQRAKKAGVAPKHQKAPVFAKLPPKKKIAKMTKKIPAVKEDIRHSKMDVLKDKVSSTLETVDTKGTKLQNSQ